MTPLNKLDEWWWRNRAETYRRALLDEFYNRLPELDYQVSTPDGTKWEWEQDPTYKLLDLTNEDCFYALQKEEVT